MSRPKSPERIQAEADKAIRTERRTLKMKIKEAAKIERERKRASHERLEKNGTIQIKAEDRFFSIRDAIDFKPLMICGRCGTAVREELENELCERCRYSKEVIDNEEIKTEAHRAEEPDEGNEREAKPPNNTNRPAPAQLVLGLELILT